MRRIETLEKAPAQLRLPNDGEERAGANLGVVGYRQRRPFFPSLRGGCVGRRDGRLGRFLAPPPHGRRAGDARAKHSDEPLVALPADSTGPSSSSSATASRAKAIR